MNIKDFSSPACLVSLCNISMLYVVRFINAARNEWKYFGEF